MEDIGLYDSSTGQDLETLKVVDVTVEQTKWESAKLIYARAKRGRIVQLCTDGMRIHYFFDETGGKLMMMEDSTRFGFVPGRLHALALQHAPEA